GGGAAEGGGPPAPPATRAGWCRARRAGGRGCRTRGLARALRSARRAASPGSGTASDEYLADASRDREGTFESDRRFQAQGQWTVLPDQGVAGGSRRAPREIQGMARADPDSRLPVDVDIIGLPPPQRGPLYARPAPAL